MIREVWLRVLLIALPFAIYGLYLILLLAQQRKRTRPHPWTALFIAGLSLFVVSFLVWGLTEGERGKGLYVPPNLVNGKIVPGHVEKTP